MILTAHMYQRRVLGYNRKLCSHLQGYIPTRNSVATVDAVYLLFKLLMTLISRSREDLFYLNSITKIGTGIVCSRARFTERLYCKQGGYKIDGEFRERDFFL